MRGICPRCGMVVEVGRRRGEGDAEGLKITRLAGIKLQVLQVLAELQGQPDEERVVQAITRQVNRYRTLRLQKPQRPIPEHRVGTSLSKLLARGLVTVENLRVQLLDSEQREWDYLEKPVWSMTHMGLQALVTGILPPPPEAPPRDSWEDPYPGKPEGASS